MEFSKSDVQSKKILSQYDFGGREVTSVNLLLLISDLEGTSQHLKFMGFKDDMDTINEMKKKYYKMYFKTSKQEKSLLD
jgi:hypothetical protein|tara:strand:+ start:777 stop:1013 length:237 start_codon:yes stop_codon:yes gene_type:complete